MEEILKAAKKLRKELDPLTFAKPVAHVYQPLHYAWAAHEAYVSQYARSGATLLVGMNPGPFGMMQTGVPFGEVSMVKDWLSIKAKIAKPKTEHPKRPILGFETTRSEVSGARLWGWVRDRFKEPDAFFDRFFVYNYCPLAFLGETGANITPDKLSRKERDAIESACDAALLRVAKALDAPRVIGVGAYAKDVIDRALEPLPALRGRITHPSPASPRANSGWARIIEEELTAMGIELPP